LPIELRYRLSHAIELRLYLIKRLGRLTSAYLSIMVAGHHRRNRLRASRRPRPANLILALHLGRVLCEYSTYQRTNERNARADRSACCATDQLSRDAAANRATCTDEAEPVEAEISVIVAIARLIEHITFSLVA
jgi:hypothetical protein